MVKYTYMATYKVPQDVEAEDRLLGPFTFRQFIYLLISAGSIAVTVGLFQIFPLLAIIPLPIVGFFLVLALPLKKDQPMETYLASVASFYLKPNKRLWTAGQKETTIKITAPKIVEKPRARNITEQEASSRLSFLSNLVDSEGYSIRSNSNFNEEFIAETNNVPDILDQNNNQFINQMIAKEQENRHANLISNMKNALSNTDNINTSPTSPSPALSPQFINGFLNQSQNPNLSNQFKNLANNQVFTIDTISKQANRLSQTSTPSPSPQPKMPVFPYSNNIQLQNSPAPAPVPPQNSQNPSPINYTQASSTSPSENPLSVPQPSFSTSNLPPEFQSIPPAPPLSPFTPPITQTPPQGIPPQNSQNFSQPPQNFGTFNPNENK